MTITAEEFVEKFHSLEGTTIAQRRKNLFILLHSNAYLKGKTEVLDAINIAPRTFLESLFKLEVLIYFRRVEELIQLLKEGNEIFVSKISRQIWFFKAAFGEVEADKLVNEILPSMSYSVRKKILRKLCQFSCSEVKFDKIFNAVAARYGIFIASRYITGCSPAKIIEVLTEYPVKLTSVQLKVLYKKDATLIEYYFDNNRLYFHESEYRHFLRFLYCQDPALYFYLKQKYTGSMIRLGRRLTKKYLKDHKNAIIQNPSNFNYLRMRTVIRKLGKLSIELFYNFLPSDFSRIRTIQDVVNKFPKKFHYNLYVKEVESYYKTKYAEHADIIDKYLLYLISDHTERAVLAKVKVDDGCDDYIKFLTIQDSIPQIKDKINLTSDIYERGRLVKYLIETCYINKNIEALTQVMKYFCFRHKNDEINVHMQFIYKIENLFGFENFTEEMWNYLNELLTIHMLKFDDKLTTYQKIQTLPLVKFNRGTSSYQKLSYLNFLFKKNEAIDELLLEYINSGGDTPEWGKYGKSFEKHYIMFVINKNSSKSLNNKQIERNCSLLNDISTWNDYYNDDKISFYDFPFMVKSFDYAIRNFKYINHEVRTVLRNKIFTTENNIYRDTYLEVYWQKLDSFCSSLEWDFEWFLKYDPLELLKNFDKFISKMIESGETTQLKLWHMAKKYTHLQLDTKLMEFCLAKIGDETCLQHKPSFVTCLSVIMKPQDFVVLADTYKPASKKLDLNNETEVKLYNLQCSIAQHFKNLHSYEVLPSLLNYCAGDYFKYSLKSLYSILYHTPENMLPQYLKHLANKAVSVRKHALYFTCELCTVSEVENMLDLLSKTEGVQSLQKKLFSATIQFFVKNPADRFFEMVKKNMLNIDKTDDESHSCIVDNCSAVPLKYRPSYIQYSWEYLEKTIDIWKKLLPLKESLVGEINRETMLKRLPLEFVLGILNAHFLVGEKEIFFSAMSSLAFSFLLCRDEKTTILETVLSLVDQRSASRSTAFEFFYHWHDKIMCYKNGDLQYMEPFVKYFENRINIVKHFNDHLKIFFLKTKLFHNDDLVTTIFTFYENLIATYSPFVIRLFSNELSKMIHHLTLDQYCYYNKLIEAYPVPIVAMLILNVLSAPSTTDASDFNLFKQILHVIEKISDLGIQINLHNKFSSYLTENKNEHMDEGDASMNDDD